MSAVYGIKKSKTKKLNQRILEKTVHEENTEVPTSEPLTAQHSTQTRLKSAPVINLTKSKR